MGESMRAGGRAGVRRVLCVGRSVNMRILHGLRDKDAIRFETQMPVVTFGVCRNSVEMRPRSASLKVF